MLKEGIEMLQYAGGGYLIGLHAAGRWCLKTMIEECYFDFPMALPFYLKMIRESLLKKTLHQDPH